MVFFKYVFASSVLLSSIIDIERKSNPMIAIQVE